MSFGGIVPLIAYRFKALQMKIVSQRRGASEMAQNVSRFPRSLLTAMRAGIMRRIGAVPG